MTPSSFRPGARKPRRPRQGSLSVAELRVESMATGGAALARLPNGQALFVPRGAPGDLLEVEVDTASKPPRGRLLRVVEPGSGRVEPPCPQVARCGGCDWMHLAPAVQLQQQASLLRDQLRHLAGVQVETLPELVVHPAPATLAYRTRARLLVRGNGRSAHVGYRRAESHDMLSVDRCAVLAPPLEQALPALAPALLGVKGEGDLLLALGTKGLPALDLGFRGEVPGAVWTRLDEKVRSGVWAGVRFRLEGTSQPAVFGDPTLWMQGSDGKPLALAPGGFAQASEAGALLLAQRVAALGLGADGSTRPPQRIVELHCGSGTFSVALARGAASYRGVELDAGAVLQARANLQSRGLPGQIVEGDAETFALPPNTDLVVLDPPRTGARGSAQQLARSKPKVVVYVSCDPPTLARDLGTLLGAGYTLTDLELLQLFPQTSHVEVLARLERGRPSGSAAGPRSLQGGA